MLFHFRYTGSKMGSRFLKRMSTAKWGGKETGHVLCTLNPLPMMMMATIPSWQPTPRWDPRDDMTCCTRRKKQLNHWAGGREKGDLLRIAEEVKEEHWVCVTQNSVTLMIDTDESLTTWLCQRTAVLPSLCICFPDLLGQIFCLSTVLQSHQANLSIISAINDLLLYFGGTGRLLYKGLWISLKSSLFNFLKYIFVKVGSSNLFSFPNDIKS